MNDELAQLAVVSPNHGRWLAYCEQCPWKQDAPSRDAAVAWVADHLRDHIRILGIGAALVERDA